MMPRPTRGEVLAVALAVLVYLGTRTWNLTALPMFFDEATHILWGERLHGPHGLSRAAVAGKLLHAAACGIAIRLHPGDSLLAVRLVTVLAGVVTLLAAWWLGRRAGGAAGGAITLALLVTSPFLLFHDRLALADPLVSAFSALALVATLALCDLPDPRRGFALGVALAAAASAKILGLLALAPSLLGVTLLAPRSLRAWKGLALAFATAGLLLWYPVRTFLTRGAAEIGEKAAPLGGEHGTLVAANVAAVGEWLWIYWTLPVLVAGLVATVLAVVRWRRLEVLLAFAWLFPLTVFVLGARLWYPRYILFTTVPFLVLAAGVLAGVWRRARGRLARGATLALVGAVLAPGILFDADLLHDPVSARLPRVDRWQYVEGWPSGYGWAGAHDFLVDAMRSEAGPHRVATERYHWTLRASFVDRPDVQVKAFDVGRPVELARAARAGYRWLVVSRPVGPERPPGLELTHVAGFTKPGREGTVNVYRMGWSDPGPG